MSRAATVIITALSLSSSAHAVNGCLTAMEELAPRSDVVVVGQIVGAHTSHFSECAPKVPDASGRKTYSSRKYLRCGDIALYDIAVTCVLRGAAPPNIVALSPRPEFELACDDRPGSDEMNGTHGIIFLEQVGDALWVVDGPDGVQPDFSPASDEFVARAVAALKAHPRVVDATDGK